MESQFKLELNLQQISLIQIVINLWEQKAIKLKIKKSIINSDKSLDYYYPIDTEKKEWINTILQQIQQLNLNNSMKNILSYMVKPIGDRLLDWLTRISKRLKNSTMYPTINDYIDNINWTTIGTIDEIKIFKKIYHNKPNNELINTIFLFEESCNYCLKKYIIKMWNKFEFNERDVIWSKCESNGPTPDIYNLIYWILYLSDDKLLDFIKSYLPNDYLPYKGLTDKRNMFNFSSSIGNDLSVKYFFNHLNDYEKFNDLIPAAELLLFNEKERQYNRSLAPLTKQKNLTIKFNGDTLVFFLQQMTNDMRILFLKKSCNFILGSLIREWPWRFLYLTILDYCWDFFDDNNYRILFDNIIYTIIDENTFFGTMKYSSLWLIGETWNKSPDKYKKSIVLMCWFSNKHLIDKLEHISIIAAAINDTGIEKIKQDIIDGFKYLCDNFFNNNKYPVIESFLNNILKNNDEIQAFLEKITDKVYKSFYVYSSHDKAQHFLNWRFNNNSDKLNYKNYWKNSIDCVITVFEIIRNHKKFDKQLEYFFLSMNLTKIEMLKLKERIFNHVSIVKKQLEFDTITNDKYDKLIYTCDYFIFNIMRDEE